MNKKLLLIGLLIFLLFSLSGCDKGGQETSVQKPSEKVPVVEEELEVPQQPLADWKEFVSPEHGFSFSYPSDWKLEGPNKGENYYNLSLKKEDNTQEKVLVYEEKMTPYYSISVSVEDNTKGLTPKEKRLSYYGEKAREKAEAEMESLKVGGYPAVKTLEGTAPSSGPSTMVTVGRGNKFFNFTYSALAHKDTHNKYLPTFDKLLETVTFAK